VRARDFLIFVASMGYPRVITEYARRLAQPRDHGAARLGAAAVRSIVCGSAATVRDTLRDYRAAMGFGNLLTMLQFGTMPGEMTAQNQRRFAEGVIKPLRAEAAAMAAQ
jgi:hypothetical protein